RRSLYTRTRPRGARESNSGSRPLRDGGSEVLPAAVRRVLEGNCASGSVSVVPSTHLRRLARLDDGELVARSGVARGVSAGSTSTPDGWTVRRPIAAGWDG